MFCLHPENFLMHCHFISSASWHTSILKTMLQMILFFPLHNQHFFFIRPLGVPIDCVTSFEILPQSTLDCTRFKTTECSSNKLHIVAINRQVHFKLANTLTSPPLPHIHAPESPVSMIMHSCQSRCCVTKQISDLNLSQTFKKLKQVFKAKGIVKAFQTPLLHS